MPSGALFGNSSAFGGSSGGSKHLVEFRAGRMILKDRMMHPDNRKGFLYIYQTDDSLIHFCWKDRTTGAVEDDLIIFPDDCEFLRVSQCTTGRVYVLKFKSSCRKLFFWMQEPKTDKDDEWCRRINEVLNNPPTVGSGRGGSGVPDGDLQNLLNNMSQQQLMQLFGGVGQIGGLSSLLGTMRSPPSQNSRSNSSTPTGSRPPSEPPRAPARPSRTVVEPATPTTPVVTTATATGTTTASAAPTITTRAGQAIHLSDLRKYLSGLTSPPEEGSGSSNTASGRVSQLPEDVDLGSVIPNAEVIASSGQGAQGFNVSALRKYLSGLTPEDGSGSSGAASGSISQFAENVDLSSVMSNAEVIAAAGPHAQGLKEYLPQPPPDMPQDDIKTTILSPQFAQAMSLFSNAMSTGQLGPIISQFGLGSEAVAAAQKGDMKAFIKALENDEKNSKGEEKPKEKSTEDDNMSLD